MPKRNHSLIICELGFDEPDPQRPQISLHEVDCYSYLFSRNTADIEENWLSDWRPHRLSLRKNLITKNFELYKNFEDREEAIYCVGDFATVLNEMNNLQEKLSQKAWKHSRDPDVACTHKFPIVDTAFCPRYRETWKGI